MEVAPPRSSTSAARFVDYAPVAAVLARRGLVTEKFSSRIFPQRRFENDGERDHVLRKLAAADIDSAGKEDSGSHGRGGTRGTVR